MSDQNSNLQPPGDPGPHRHRRKYFRDPINEFHRWSTAQLDISKPKTFLYAAIWISAGVVGVAAVMYARLIAHFQNVFFRYFNEFPAFVSATGPFLFVIATWLVKQLAPDAKGSGIPQVLAAIDHAKEPTGGDDMWRSRLVSMRTAFIKVVSSAVGILGGASIGREGPTVQIAASGFAWIGHKIRKFAPQVDFQTFLIAGAAAGVAAAFNTPIAGITFALEEIVSGAFGAFRQTVMLSIIISGVIAQGLNGNYLYFGHPTVMKIELAPLIGQSILIGIVGGILGGVFAKILAEPNVTRLPAHWLRRAFVAGAICSAIGYFTHGSTAGSGYEGARNILNSGTIEDVSLLFPIFKFATTVFSYLSGMAGGIFSPCLSIGAGIGLSIAKLTHVPEFKICALMGMVAFFSGAVRAPLTAVIIVTEMTDEHILVIPFMIAAYLAYTAGRRIMEEPLYHYLARKHLEG